MPSRTLIRPGNAKGGSSEIPEDLMGEDRKLVGDWADSRMGRDSRQTDDEEGSGWFAEN